MKPVLELVNSTKRTDILAQHGHLRAKCIDLLREFYLRLLII